MNDSSEKPGYTPIKKRIEKQIKKINITSYAKAFKDVESDEDLDDVVDKFRAAC